MILQNTLFLMAYSHFVADFVCQSGWMAMNKSKNWKALLAHSSTYFSVTLIITYGFVWSNQTSVQDWLIFNLIQWVSHHFIDFVTSKCTTKLWQLPDKHWFFTMIGFDQFLHMAVITKTMCLLVTK